MRGKRPFRRSVLNRNNPQYLAHLTIRERHSWVFLREAANEQYGLFGAIRGAMYMKSVDICGYMEEKGISQLISVDFCKKSAAPAREEHSLHVDVQGPFALERPNSHDL